MAKISQSVSHACSTVSAHVTVCACACCLAVMKALLTFIWNGNYFVRTFFWHYFIFCYDKCLLLLSIVVIEFIKRVIVHPSFLNITFTEAEEHLKTSDQGEGIFRPSSQVQYYNTDTSGHWNTDTFIIYMYKLPLSLRNHDTWATPMQWCLQ